MTTTIWGHEVRPGTVLLFLGERRTVTRLEPYQFPGELVLGPARHAYSGDEWYMTIFDEDRVEVDEVLA